MIENTTLRTYINCMIEKGCYLQHDYINMQHCSHNKPAASEEQEELEDEFEEEHEEEDLQEEELEEDELEEDEFQEEEVQVFADEEDDESP